MTSQEASELAQKLLEIYNIEEILAISDLEEQDALTFLLYWDQIDIPEDILTPVT